MGLTPESSVQSSRFIPIRVIMLLLQTIYVCRWLGWYLDKPHVHTRPSESEILDKVLEKYDVCLKNNHH